MADQEKIGKPWADDELDAIVADYFSMLAAERVGRSYVKADHSRALMEAIGRTHRSVEFKHMNISAVLRDLGMPTIRGYKPKFNIQNAIYDAIERYLTLSPMQLQSGSPDLTAILGVADPAVLFEEQAPTLAPSSYRPPPLERLIRKFDPSERDHRNRALGRAGEALIFDFERRRLEQFERSDLARKVRWVAQEDGDGAGYDILSFDRTGEQRMIEVKTTCGSQRTPFFLTRNERKFAEERPSSFRIFRVYEFGDATRFFKIRPPLSNAVLLEPETYRASFG